MAPGFGRLGDGLKSYVAPQVVVVVRPTEAQVQTPTLRDQFVDQMVDSYLEANNIEVDPDDVDDDDPYDFDSPFGRGTIPLGLTLVGQRRMWPASNAAAGRTLLDFAQHAPILTAAKDAVR